jgi:hypothetical protein
MDPFCREINACKEKGRTVFRPAQQAGDGLYDYSCNVSITP